MNHQQYPMDVRGILCDPNNDGTTHINIYSKGNTIIGRDLSFFSNKPFTHPMYGYFQSLEGFYHYIATGMQHDVLRTLYGLPARQYGKSVPKVAVQNFQFIIAEAVELMLNAHPDVKMSLVKTTLPFTHYYVYNEGWAVTIPTQHHWVVELYEHLRLRFSNI